MSNTAPAKPEGENNGIAMRLVSKLTLAAVVPVFLIWAVGLSAIRTSRDQLRETIAADSTARSHALMDEIDRMGGTLAAIEAGRQIDPPILLPVLKA